MKGMKGKMMKKLKSAKPIAYLNPDRILQVSALDGFVDNFNLKSAAFVDKFHFKSYSKSHSSPQNHPKSSLKNREQPEKPLVEELMRDQDHQKDQDFDSDSRNDVGDKENTRPSVYQDAENPSSCCSELRKNVDSKNSSSCCSELRKEVDYLEIDVLSFRRPDMDSGTLFDPKLLSAFYNAVSEQIRACEAAAQVKTCEKKQKYPFFQPEEEPDPLSEFEDKTDPLLEFEEKCPPGGSDSVIFYSTSLRGIRKTFEDCQSIRFLLKSFGLVFYERDVSVHSDYRDELWRIMGERALPPRLFIRGRYIGGADKVLTLHEQGRLRPLFRDIPIDFSEGPCNVCCGLRFMLCYDCNGSRKVIENCDEGGSRGTVWTKCLQCNENGLVVCPLC